MDRDPGYRGISYQDMVEYVRTQTRPLEDHMNEHDAWHLTQMIRANDHLIARLTSLLSILVAVGAIAVNLLHH